MEVARPGCGTGIRNLILCIDDQYAAPDFVGTPARRRPLHGLRAGSTLMGQIEMVLSVHAPRSVTTMRMKPRYWWMRRGRHHATPAGTRQPERLFHSRPANGKFCARSFVDKLNWLSVDGSGRPMLSGRIPSAEGTYICPGIDGATNWFSPLQPRYWSLLCDCAESCNQFFARLETLSEVIYYNTGTARADEHSQKIVLALSVADGKPVWRYLRWARRVLGGTRLPLVDCVFWGRCRVPGGVDASTGRTLWHFNTGQRFRASPMTPRSMASNLRSRRRATFSALRFHIDATRCLKSVVPPIAGCQQGLALSLFATKRSFNRNCPCRGTSREVVAVPGSASLPSGQCRFACIPEEPRCTAEPSDPALHQ
jgi:hypothetical protein